MRRRAEPELGPMPATLAPRCSSLALPSHGRDPSPASCRGGPLKGKARSNQRGPPPQLPSARSQISGRSPSWARASLKRLALASAWLPYPPGWLARGPPPSGAALEVVDLRARWAVRCGADGWLATGGARPAKDEIIAVMLAIPAAVAPGTKRQTARPLDFLQKRPPLFLDSNIHRPYLFAFLSPPKDRVVDHGLVHVFSRGLSARRI